MRVTQSVLGEAWRMASGVRRTGTRHSRLARRAMSAGRSSEGHGARRRQRPADDGRGGPLAVTGGLHDGRRAVGRRIAGGVDAGQGGLQGLRVAGQVPGTGQFGLLAVEEVEQSVLAHRQQQGVEGQRELGPLYR